MSTFTPAGTDRGHDKPVVQTPQISMREIDLDHLEDSDENPESIRFEVLLSEAPSEGWLQEFDLIYRQTPYVLKPPAEIKSDRLQITFLPRYSGDLQQYFQFLALIIGRANEEARKSEELHTSSVSEQRKARFREDLRRVQLPTVR